MEKIYIIEDDVNIRNLLNIAVGGFHYQPICFSNAEDALDKIAADRPDMAIFDLMLPGMDGMTAIRRIRRMPEIADIPILILTAKDKELDKVTGLDGGADDYMVKPFGVLELGARIRSLLRRKGQSAQQERIEYKDLAIDEGLHEVTQGGVTVSLTNKEFKLLRYLMERPGFVATRDELLNSIWGYEYDGESRTVDMHIKSLRQKLGDEDGSLIQTVRGIGYKLK